eukprot:m51a1_g13359 hypothetical protein (214) ;mRNA; f:1278-2300
MAHNCNNGSLVALEYFYGGTDEIKSQSCNVSTAPLYIEINTEVGKNPLENLTAERAIEGLWKQSFSGITCSGDPAGLNVSDTFFVGNLYEGGCYAHTTLYFRANATFAVRRVWHDASLNCSYRWNTTGSDFNDTIYPLETCIVQPDDATSIMYHWTNPSCLSRSSSYECEDPDASGDFGLNCTWCESGFCLDASELSCRSSRSASWPAASGAA